MKHRFTLNDQRLELIALVKLYLVPYPRTIERAELNRMARALLCKIEQLEESRKLPRAAIAKAKEE